MATERRESDQQQRKVVHEIERKRDAAHRAGAEHGEHRERTAGEPPLIGREPARGQIEIGAESHSAHRHIRATRRVERGDQLSLDLPAELVTGDPRERIEQRLALNDLPSQPLGLRLHGFE